MLTIFALCTSETHRTGLALLVGILLCLVPARALAQTYGKPSDTQQQAGYGETVAAPGTQPIYPGIGTSQKLETTVGPFNARFYGTLLMNVSGSDAAMFGQDLPLWAVSHSIAVTYPDGSVGRAGDNHDLIFTMRQSILGATLNLANPPENGWTPSGLVEFDFFGSRPVDTSQPLNRVLDQPRLRLAYLQLEHKGIKIVAGQDRAILAPLDPISLSHVAVPLGATAGNLWAWLPQFRVDLSHKIGNTGMLFQVGILRPTFGDPRLETPPAAGTSIDVLSSGLGERSTQPFYEARFALSPELHGSKATFGVSGHFGEEKIGVNNMLQSWAFAFDMSVPFDRHLVLRGEGFVGSNLIPFQGGIDQGAAVLASPTSGAPPLNIRRIGAGGGWAELTLLPTSDGKNAVYLGAGTDDPRNGQLLPGTTRGKNSFVWASYFRKITDAVTVALEWSNWQFQTVGFIANRPGPRGATGTGNVFNLSFAYQF